MTKFTSAAPHIACYMLLHDNNKFAFLLRQNTGWMDGYYGLPAGRVEWGESFKEAAVREAHEEVGITIDPKDIRHSLTIHRHKEDSDWVDVYFNVETWQGTVTNAEPEIHGELTWFEIDKLPGNIMPSLKHALENIAAGETYAEYGWENS